MLSPVAVQKATEGADRDAGELFRIVVEAALGRANAEDLHLGQRLGGRTFKEGEGDGIVPMEAFIVSLERIGVLQTVERRLYFGAACIKLRLEASPDPLHQLVDDRLAVGIDDLAAQNRPARVGLFMTSSKPGSSRLARASKSFFGTS